MITIPVVINFDQQRRIGTIVLDESQLPNTPDYVFSIGYVATDRTVTTVTRHKLTCISMQSDEEHLRFVGALRRGQFQGRNEKNTGGAAFPYAHYDGIGFIEQGMILRDWFAGMAMASLVDHITLESPAPKIAMLAYQIADAMLKEREK